MNNAGTMLDNLIARRAPFIAQTEASECGLACLAMILAFHGKIVDLRTLRNRFPVSLKGMTLGQIGAVSDDLGLIFKPAKVDLGEIGSATLPALLHWDLNHYVILSRIKMTLRGKRFTIHDPARGIINLDEPAFSRHFTGIIAEFEKEADFNPSNEKHNLSIGQLWSSITGFWPNVRTLIILSTVFQVIALLMPFYLQFAIDDALASADIPLLTALAIGFSGLALISFFVATMRGIISQTLANSISFQIVYNLFRHLVSLPISWFEKRHSGDVISRFNSAQPISSVLSQGIVTGFIDGAVSITTIIVMAIYVPVLVISPIVALSIYALLRWAFFKKLKLSNNDAISSAARENSFFIETVRGIQSIKLFGREAVRSRQWANKKAQAVNAQLQLTKTSGVFDNLNQLVLTLEQIIFIYISIKIASTGSITVGMIFAFQSYKQQFLPSAVRLTEQFISWRMLQLHLARISDIALSVPERRSYSTMGFEQWNGRLELRNVFYRYGSNEPDILVNASFSLEKDQSVAIIGRSGGGKTTFTKILLALNHPTSGQYLVGDRPIRFYSLEKFRNLISSVSQDDVLYAGTIGENIAFWDPDIDYDLIHTCADIACISEEVRSMPLGFDTLVGDMGSALSGGQKARVLIARALYQQPKILVLDEATGQLDLETEKRVLEKLSELPISKIFVTHRRQPLTFVDRVWQIDAGKLIRVPDAAHEDMKRRFREHFNA